MQVQEYKGTDERVAIASICLNDDILSKVVHILEDCPFSSKAGNIIASWCKKHFEQYSCAPGVAGLTAIHGEWVTTTGSKADGETIGSLLRSLPSDLSMSVEYAVDLISKCVLRAKMKAYADNILGAISQGKLEAAAQTFESFQRPETKENGADGIFLLEQLDDIDEVLNKTNAGSLIKFPERLKAMGEFFGPTLCRDGFVSFVAPEKGGKSTHLAALACMAVTQGLRVAYFNLGDLSEDQYRKRFYTPFARRPAVPSKYKIPKSLKYEDKEPKVEFSQRYEPTGYTADDVRAAIIQHQGTDAKRFRLKTSPAGKMTIFDVRHFIMKWANEGWCPDIIAIDYADILGYPPGVKEKKDFIDISWREMRAMSTEFHSLVLTATQSNKDGYSAWTLGMENFSGGKEKNAHVTAMIGLNMTQTERRMQTCRMNMVALREADYLTQLPGQIIGVSGCTLVGHPHIISTWI